MTGDILRILLLLLLQLGFVALLYLVLMRFAGSLLRDLRNAEQAQLAARSGIGRLSVLESPADEPPDGDGHRPRADQLDRSQREQHDLRRGRLRQLQPRHAHLPRPRLVRGGPGQHERHVRQRASHRPRRWR